MTEYIIPGRLSIPEETIDSYEKIGKFPTLYRNIKRGKVDKKGFWHVEVGQNDMGYGIIVIRNGDVGGKEKEPYKDIIRKGTNIGRSNEKNPYEAAKSKAASHFKKKLKDKYFPENLDTGSKKKKIFPMLALKYLGHEDKLKIPFAVQRKLDGFRCLARLSDDGKSVVLHKRKMGEISDVLFGGIRNELYHTFFRIYPKIWLDGEIYKHGVPLQKINIAGKKTIKKSDIDFMQKLEYHIYDCFFLDKMDMKFKERIFLIADVFKAYKFKNVKFVRSIGVNPPSDAVRKIINQYLDKFALQENYEGIMLRNLDGIYKLGDRSPDLLKYKPRETEEYKIVGMTKVESDDGVFRITMEVLLEDGKTILSVNGSGSSDYRESVYKEKERYIGQFLRIAFFGRTEDYIPKFAVPEMTKDDEYVIFGKEDYE